MQHEKQLTILYYYLHCLYNNILLNLEFTHGHPASQALKETSASCPWS
jgi:hypothetical protein